jgi:hypothetical protein
MLNSTKERQESTKKPKKRDSKQLSRKLRELEVLLLAEDSTEVSTEEKESKKEPRNLNISRRLL